MKFDLPKIILTLILLLGFVLRIAGIADTPPSLNWDEVSHGYNAYSILKTGKDEWGVTLPTIFRAYGDYKLPVYIYATAASEFFFGLSAFAVRFPSVLAGVATIFFTYLLAKKLFNIPIALLSAFLVAIEPWSFFLSRGAFEANFSLPLIIGGAYFFPHPLSALLFGLSVWTYNSARIFVPLLLVLLLILHRARKPFPYILYSLLSILFFVPMFWQLLNPAGQARYGRVAILDEGAVQQINRSRGQSGLPEPLPRLIHNKATFFAGRFAQNYISHFSPEFLFLKGGSNFQFNVPGNGLLYLVNAPFFLVGAFFLAKRSRKRSSWLVLGWLLLAPIPSSLTREAPHTLRAITMLPMPMIIASIGLVEARRWWQDKIRNSGSAKRPFLQFEIRNALRIIPVAAYFILLAAFAEVYFFRYFFPYRVNYSQAWQYGYTWVVDYAKANYDEYDRIITTKKYGEPHEFFLFYWPWPPEQYRNDPNLIRFPQSNWYWVDRFDKFYFVNDWDVPKDGSASWRMESGANIPLEGRTLLITSPGNVPPGWRKLKQILFLDGTRAFEIYEK